MFTVPRSDRLPRYWHAITVSGLLLIVGGCGGGGGSSPATASANLMPAISSLAPASAAAGAAAQTLAINGSGFISGSTVTYNGVAHPATFVSATQLTIQLTTADQAMAGPYVVIVTNAPPAGGVSNSAIFTVTSASAGSPVPAITSLAPASATAASAAPTLTISGSGFMSASTVTYNSIAHTATYVSATQLTIQLSTADLATVGSYAVVVTNPAPGGGPSNTATFTVSPVIPPGAATVLITGGQSAAATPLKSAELFASATFGGTGAMTVARYRPTASLLAGGTVLVTGGSDATGVALNTAETYQVATKTFGAATLTMKCAHQGHTATVLASGQVLIAGRDGTTTTACAELYDPATGTFTRTTGDMTTPLSDHAAVLLPSGKVLIVGGAVDGVGCQSCAATKAAELYDPTSGTFTATAHALAFARSSPTATLLPSGKVLITGGGNTPTSGPVNTSELYDPLTDTFTLTGTMTTERQFHTATLLANGQVLVAGGLTNAATATMTAELYDPATATFYSTGAMASARLYHTATLVANGLVLVAGGTTQLTTGTGDSSAELYDSTSGVFTLTGSLLTGRYGAAATPLQ